MGVSTRLSIARVATSRVPDAYVLPMAPDASSARRVRRSGFVRLLLLVALSPPLLAQEAAPRFAMGADVVFATRDVWRGLPRTGSWVAQPSLHAALATSSAMFTAGAWLTAELRDPPPGAGKRVGAAEYWAQVELVDVMQRFDVTGGVVRYGYRSLHFDNTTELYAALRLIRRRGNAPLRHPSPLIRAYYDVGRVRGAYVEMTLEHPVPVLPLISPVNLSSLLLSATTGASFGQDEYFERSGITHTDLAASMSRSFRDKRVPVWMNFGVHYRLGFDPATRRAPAQRSLWWGELSLSVATRHLGEAWR